MSIRRLILTLAIAAVSAVSSAAGVFADEIYGPVNLRKTIRTPFGGAADAGDAEPGSAVALRPMSLESHLSRSLSSRLLPPRLYLPGRMVIGSTAEFIIKGRPGYWAALAMADKNTGAKPIYGHQLHLGPDRKLVSIGQIPDTGVLSLVIDTPIDGDMIGQPLFFEAAIWSRPDFSDMELASPVPSESTAAIPAEHNNGVLVAAEPEHKRGVRIVPDSTIQLQQVQGHTSLDSGRP